MGWYFMTFLMFDKLNLPLQEKSVRTFAGKPIVETDSRYLKMQEIQVQLRSHYGEIQKNTGVDINVVGVNPHTYKLEVGISDYNWWNERKLRYAIFKALGQRVPLIIHYSEPIETGSGDYSPTKPANRLSILVS